MVPDHTEHHARGDIDGHALHLAHVPLRDEQLHLRNVSPNVLEEQNDKIDVEAYAKGIHCHERDLSVAVASAVLLLLIVDDRL